VAVQAGTGGKFQADEMIKLIQHILAAIVVGIILARTLTLILAALQTLHY
jgi:hypothetical protein